MWRSLFDQPREDIAMSNKGLLATVAAVALATTGVISQAHAAVSLPGSPEPTIGIAKASLDPFKMVFDENGNAFVQIFSGGSYGPPTVIKPIVGDPFLTWNLPQPVVPGDVSFAEPPTASCTSSSASNCSDGLRFTLAGGKSTMSFFSDIESGEPRALADTGFPDNFDFTSFAFKEVGSEKGLNGFIYNAGPGDPALTNVYTGISDNVPEASTWAMMIIGFAGLGYAAFRRARVSVSAA
jgi:hypothetical protein